MLKKRIEVQILKEVWEAIGRQTVETGRTRETRTKLKTEGQMGRVIRPEKVEMRDPLVLMLRWKGGIKLGEKGAGEKRRSATRKDRKKMRMRA